MSKFDYLKGPGDFDPPGSNQDDNNSVDVEYWTREVHRYLGRVLDLGLWSEHEDKQAIHCVDVQDWPSLVTLTNTLLGNAQLSKSDAKVVQTFIHCIDALLPEN